MANTNNSNNIINAMTQLLLNISFIKPKFFIIIIIVMTLSHADLTWDNRVQLDENYLLQWSVKEPDIVFEMQVAAHGYIGFGLSRDGTIFGSDIFISWIDGGHMFFYDCHINTHTQTHEPVVDTSQDYELLAGSENATHTILRFRRKLNTCDDKSDVPITNNTMNIIFLYHDEKPKRGQFLNENLPNLLLSQENIRPILLLQHSPILPSPNNFSSFDIRALNVSVKSPSLLKWCHGSKINYKNHHVIRYEPIFASNESRNFITFMRLYECRSDNNVDYNGECSERLKSDKKCLTIVAIWTKGSEGFTYPIDTAYSLDFDAYLLEVHYQDVHSESSPFIDSSGFKFFYTNEARKFDAGTISINIRPNFLHIIAPGFKRVTSIGHCTSNCTTRAFPHDGINIFGISMQTHSAGTMIKLTAVRDDEELEPLAHDSNLNANYVETRLLQQSRKLYPGDHLMVECTYNTFKRERFTLGGESSNEEVCMAMIMYYPRQRQLTACNSQAKISDVLKALGVEELGKYGNQTVIAKPEKYAGRTLEKHLELYEWKNEFSRFDSIIKTSPFDGYCNSIDSMQRISDSPPVIKKPHRPSDSICNNSNAPRPNKFTNDDETSENSIDDSEKSKALRSPSTLQQHTSNDECTKATISIFITITFIHIVVFIV